MPDADTRPRRPGKKNRGKPVPKGQPAAPAGRKTRAGRGHVERALLFADLYMGEARMNATKAARLAGYTGDGVNARGYKLLREPVVLERLAEIRLERALKTDMNRDELVRIAREIALGDTIAVIGHYNGKVVMGRPKHSDRLRAVEFIAEMEGFKVTKIEAKLTAIPASEAQLEEALALMREKRELEAALVAVGEVVT